MAFEKFPATNTQEAIAVFKQDVGIVHDVAHGDENAEVLTENGLIPSIAKFIKDTNERIGDGVTGLDHNTLGNRTAVDSHPISAITGLQTALDDINTEVDLKSDLTYVNAQLGLKVNSSTLTAATGADFIGASDSGGLTLGSVQDQLNELKALVDAIGGTMKLAPDLDYPSRLLAGSGFERATITGSAGVLTTALSLTGAWALGGLYITDLTAENIIVKLTIDGEVIWNSTFALVGTILYLNGSPTTSVNAGAIPITCETSLLLEVQTTVDNSFVINYTAKKLAA